MLVKLISDENNTNNHHSFEFPNFKSIVNYQSYDHKINHRMPVELQEIFFYFDKDFHPELKSKNI